MERLDLDRELFHFLMRSDTGKELSSKPLLRFLMSLTQDKELCSKTLDSFFNEHNTRQGTMLMTHSFIF